MAPVRRHRFIAGTAVLLAAATAAAATSAASQRASVTLTGLRGGDATVAVIELVAPSDRAASRLARGGVGVRGLGRTEAALYGTLRRRPGHTVELLAVVVTPAHTRAPSGLALSVSGARRRLVVIDRDVLARPARASAICRSRAAGSRRFAGVALRTRAGAIYPPAQLVRDALDVACGCSSSESLREALQPSTTAPSSEPAPSGDTGGGDTGGGGGGGSGGGQPQPAPRDTSMRWTNGRTADEVVGTVTSDPGYDTLIVVVPPYQSPFPGRPDSLRRITGFDAPAELPRCSLSRTRSDDDTLTCEGSVSDNSDPVTLRVRTDPGPTQDMGGQFSLRDRGQTRGPYTITGP